MQVKEKGQHLPIFPGRLHPSIFGTTQFNFCVRHGNRWDLSAIGTDRYLIAKKNIPYTQQNVKKEFQLSNNWPHNRIIIVNLYLFKSHKLPAVFFNQQCIIKPILTYIYIFTFTVYSLCFIQVKTYTAV